jgi:hypothetical protein
MIYFMSHFHNFNFKTIFLLFLQRKQTGLHDQMNASTANNQQFNCTVSCYAHGMMKMWRYDSTYTSYSRYFLRTEMNPPDLIQLKTNCRYNQQTKNAQPLANTCPTYPLSDIRHRCPCNEITILHLELLIKHHNVSPSLYNQTSGYTIPTV